MKRGTMVVAAEVTQSLEVRGRETGPLEQAHAVLGRWVVRVERPHKQEKSHEG